MKKNYRDHVTPNYVIHALIAGVLFLLVALVLGVLMFSEGEPEAGAPPPTGETVEKQSLDTRPIVVVDAGHGGSDPGAVPDFAEVTEAEITQAVADRLMGLLQQHPQELRVEPAHQPNAYSTVLARANAAVQLRADLLVSLHLNADTYPDTRGFQVFPVPPGRVHHAESLRLAQLMVERAREGTELPIKGDNGVFYAYHHEIAGGGYWRELLDSVWANEDDPSQSPSFGVVENAGCPAVLVEQWFISSHEDMRLMNDDAGYDAMAGSLYRAICDYFGLTPIE